MCLLTCRAVALTTLLSSLSMTSIASAQTFRFEIVSVTSTGAQGTGLYDYPCTSGDGRRVAFRAVGPLVPGNPTGLVQTYVHDRDTRQTRLVCVSSTGEQAGYASDTASTSWNGRFVAFRWLAGRQPFCAPARWLEAVGHRW